MVKVGRRAIFCGKAILGCHAQQGPAAVNTRTVDTDYAPGAGLGGRMTCRGLLAVVAAAGVFHLGGTAGAAPALEVYGRLPTMDHVAISPDGRAVAFETDLHGERTVLVQSVDPPSLLGGLKLGRFPLRGLTWVGADHVLLTTATADYARDVSGPRQDWDMTQSFDIAHNKTTILLKEAGTAMNVVTALPEFRSVAGRPTAILRGYYIRGTANAYSVLTPALFTVDGATNATSLVQKGALGALGWQIDDQGRPVAETDYDQKKQSWRLQLWRDGRWVDAMTLTAPLDVPEIIGFSADGASLIVKTFEGGTPRLKAVRIADGQATNADAALYDRPLLVNDPLTGRLAGGASIDGGRLDYSFLDAATQASWAGIAHAFADETVELSSWSQDRGKIVVR